MREDPKTTLQDVRQRIYAGGRLQIDELSDPELAAMYELVRNGEAEIINEACKPFVVRALDS